MKELGITKEEHEKWHKEHGGCIAKQGKSLHRATGRGRRIAAILAAAKSKRGN